MELDNLIKLAYKVAAPYRFCIWVLSILLTISMGINVYVFTVGGIDLDLYSEDVNESEITQTNVK